MKEKLRRDVWFRPAYDKRDPDPSKDFGIGSMTCGMMLIGKNGAVQFTYSTGIFLPETTKRLAAEGALDYKEFSPGHWFSVGQHMGYDVGYHALAPQYDGQSVSQKTCVYLDAPCYYDGSSLRADEYMKTIIEKGSDEIWKLLEADYAELLT